MKKTIRISLGGISFNIEEDAYSFLDDYIKSLKNHLGNTPETDEIVKDIEERAAELFSEMLGNSETLTIDMVKDVIKILGNPEQITNDEGNGTRQNTDFVSKDNIKKRLYRDGDKTIIAGVCAGLGTYFRIDPLVFRILFPILILVNGLGLIAYFILWIALPKAETARQRMEMRGEEINFENLEKNIRKEYEQVKSNLNKQKNSAFFERLFSAIGKFFIVIGKVFEGFFKVIGAILAIAFISIGLLGLTTAVGSIFFGGIVISGLVPSYSELAVSEFLSSTFDLGSLLWVSIPVFLIIAIPLISLIYLGLRMVLRFRVKDSAFFVLAASVWIASVIALAFIVFFQAHSFTIRESVKEKVELILSEPENETLIIKTLEFDNYEIIPEKPIKFDHYTIAIDNGKTTIVGKPKIYIGKASGDVFEMIIVKKSRGSTKQLAKNSANRVSINYYLNGTSLSISPYFLLSKGDKWRVQEVIITILVPEGKSIYIDESIEELLSSDQEYSFKWPDEMVGKTWVMKTDRLIEL
jgi:phage shock protein PspC (stress-responsive transcriptional regulator)